MQKKYIAKADFLITRFSKIFQIYKKKKDIHT